MPLSEHEQRILEEIEKSLYDEDPTFARGAKRGGPRIGEQHRIRLGAGMLVTGIVVMILFFATRNVLWGILSFVAMLGGIVLLTGVIGNLAPRGKTDVRTSRERATHALKRWEDRLRRKYRKD